MKRATLFLCLVVFGCSSRAVELPPREPEVLTEPPVALLDTYHTLGGEYLVQWINGGRNRQASVEASLSREGTHYTVWLIDFDEKDEPRMASAEDAQYWRAIGLAAKTWREKYGKAVKP